MAVQKKSTLAKSKRGPSSKPAARTAKNGRPRSKKNKKAEWRSFEEKDRFPVVGIGASAGGLEALRNLFEHLPLDTGMGYVVVQHLDPKHPSMLTELISRVTRMPVVEVTDGMKIEPNSVYIIPPNTRMVMMHNALCLLPRNEDGDPPMAINFFLESMATDLRNKAIGVILSGTASDGTHGLQAIKAAGGLTFAQDKATATYFGMPSSAIDSGSVDLILPPDEIAEELARIGRRRIPSIAEQESPEGPIAADTTGLAKIHFLLRSHSGVDFSHYKPATIHRRIARRMFLRKLENLSDYVKYMAEHPAEVGDLYQDLLIVVTGFFRDPEVFEFIKKVVFPQIMADKSSHDPIRFWIPGCATGEEAYSIAMALVEYLRTKPTSRLIQIFATDLSEMAIHKARIGLYSSSIVNDVTPDRLRRFFVKADGGYQVSKMVREMCVFATQDLTKDPPFSHIDFISCRNLLIYLGPVLQKRIIPMFHYALNPNGFLMLGSSESVGSFAGLFSAVDRKFKIYMKKGGGSRVTLRAQVDMAEVNSKAASADAQSPEGLPARDIQSEMERLILSRFSPPGVLVDSTFEIVRYQGNTGPYLQAPSGIPNLNVLRMAREGLLMDLRTGLQQAKKRDIAIDRQNIPVTTDNGPQLIDLEIIPIKVPASSRDRHYLILFKQSDPKALAREKAKTGDTVKVKQVPKEIGRLQKELKATRDYLQTTIEEQEATNEELHLALEEIRSSNEELQSTNEEMETAKEELQSTNEELITVNEELRNSNNELNIANNDLLNLLNNISFAVVMVDNDLRIRRFTPAASQVLNLLPADVGRPITDLRLNVDVHDFTAVVEKVLTMLTPEEIEIRDQAGKPYMMRISPYKTFDNQIEGVILSVMDVEDVRRATQGATDARKALMDFQDSLLVPVVMTDRELKILHVNPAFAKMFAVSDEDTAGKPLFTAIGGQWNTGGLGQLLERLRSPGEDFANFEVEVEVPGVGLRRIRFQGRKIEQEGAGGALLVLTVVES